MIKAVLFDFGGVLSPGGKSLEVVYSKLLGIPKSKVVFSEYHRQYRRGDISTEEFFIELSKEAGRPVTPAQFMQYSDIFVRNDAVYELAGRLRDHGIKTGILSNIYKLSADVLREDGYYTGFDPLILSCEVGFAKPDPEIYQLAIRKLGVEPQEILFIDDQDKCFPPAQALGIHTIKALSEEQIVKDIKTLIKTENGLTL